ncbi:flagellar assembly protein FliW [Ammoniphilus sp. CFH 90114]|uniref:flagellar assembly protein FliW n=1 Tax=Ammoniphilus sp. CFH 90114 TaxID=2493665 RepID=UPI00100EFF12|nr:flagellar assembly protein FliW [Ammoniphilus sp. CFH 90114]RXT04475.1 flagellar assembly protein FliW [Ammoniphilus sp. CFH 90114]
MIIITPMFGQVEVEESRVISFPNGVPGFPDSKTFVFMDLPDTSFQIMQSTEDELYFFVINPFEFFKKYEIVIPDAVIESLKIQKEEDVAIYNIVTIKDDLSQSTANMQAPIIINARSCQGKQHVLSDSKYSIRQPLFTPIAAQAVSE